MATLISDRIERLVDLEKPEHLLVWTLRAVAFGRSDCPLLSRTYDATFGREGAHAFGAYFVLVRHVTQHARRKIRVHAPGCPSVCADELAIVGAVAAAQASLEEKDETLLRMRLGFLVNGEVCEAAVFSAQHIGQILQSHGHRLPLRCGPSTIGERSPLRLVQ